MSLRTILTRPMPKRLARGLVAFSRMVTPVRNHVVVAGWPTMEGNAVEVVRHLLSAEGSRVVWLVEPGTEGLARQQLGESVDATNLMVVDKSRPRALWYFMTARCAFHTHGLFLNPPRNRRKPVVNLWHGDGPKRLTSPPGAAPPTSDVVISGSSLLAAEKVRHCAVEPDQVTLVANPRVDQFLRPTSDASLRALGLDPDKGIVVYVPTYRVAKSVGANAAWSDGGPQSQVLSQTASVLSTAIESAGHQIVVRPHPLDGSDFGTTAVADDDSLARAGTSLYSLLARTSLLITDYSSIWVDYLLLDKPVLFIVDDLDGYADTRGFVVDDLLGLLPGPIVESGADVRQACRDALSGNDNGDALRAASRAKIGLVPVQQTATGDLFTELERRGIWVPEPTVAPKHAI